MRRTAKPKYMPVIDFRRLSFTKKNRDGEIEAVEIASYLLQLESTGLKYQTDEYKKEAREFIKNAAVAFFDRNGFCCYPEFKFAPKRRWRIDYLVFKVYESTTIKVALEVEGGVWSFGRHTRGSGFVKDMEKYNEVARQQMFIIRVTPIQLFTNYTIGLLKDIIC